MIRLRGHGSRVAPRLLAMVPHRAPSVPLTVEQAYVEMRNHVGCGVYRCPRKNAALWTLMGAHRVRVDVDRYFR